MPKDGGCFSLAVPCCAMPCCVENGLAFSTPCNAMPMLMLMLMPMLMPMLMLMLMWKMQMHMM